MRRLEQDPTSTTRRADPITLEIVKNALASMADEMALVVLRSAYSPIVRDSMDYSTAIFDSQGRLIAQGPKAAFTTSATGAPSPGTRFEPKPRCSDRQEYRKSHLPPPRQSPPSPGRLSLE